jgi:hypothetical protein
VARLDFDKSGSLELRELKQRLDVPQAREQAAEGDQDYGALHRHAIRDTAWRGNEAKEMRGLIASAVGESRVDTTAEGLHAKGAVYKQVASRPREPSPDRPPHACAHLCTPRACTLQPRRRIPAERFGATPIRATPIRAPVHSSHDDPA